MEWSARRQRVQLRRQLCRCSARQMGVCVQVELSPRAADAGKGAIENPEGRQRWRGLEARPGVVVERWETLGQAAASGAGERERAGGGAGASVVGRKWVGPDLDSQSKVFVNRPKSESNGHQRSLPLHPKHRRRRQQHRHQRQAQGGRMGLFSKNKPDSGEPSWSQRFQHTSRAQSTHATRARAVTPSVHLQIVVTRAHFHFLLLDIIADFDVEASQPPLVTATPIPVDYAAASLPPPAQASANAKIAAAVPSAPPQPTQQSQSTSFPAGVWDTLRGTSRPLGRRPANVLCPNCNQESVTRTSTYPGWETWVLRQTPGEHKEPSCLYISQFITVPLNDTPTQLGAKAQKDSEKIPGSNSRRIQSSLSRN